MDASLQTKIAQWHEQDEHEKIVEAILAVPAAQRDAALVGLLARAYNNLGRCEEAARQLLTVRGEGENDPLWCYRLGYAYYYLDREAEAVPYLERACQLAPDDLDAWELLYWCCRGAGVQTKLEIPPAMRDAIAAREEARYSPEIYSEAQLDAVEGHIAAHFGEYATVFHELVSPDIHVDICVIEPTDARPYYTLVTMGMGAHVMAVPAQLRGRKLERAELLVHLPADWKAGDEAEIWYWPLRWLKILARLPGQQDTWLGWGHTVPSGEPLAENTRFACLLLTEPWGADEAAACCALPDGEQVNFYQMVPLYPDEMEYKLAHGAQALLDRMDGRMLAVVDLDRPSACGADAPAPATGGEKAFRLRGEEIRPLLTDWEGPEGCVASDRILVDGCRVGYCYRETPDEGYPDSGWRFFAGDEEEAYLDDAGHFGIYSLNTLCNYDPDLLPLLRAPAGTAYLRGEDGRFHPEPLQAEEPAR